MAVIDKDFVKLYRKEDGDFEHRATLVWGDQVELVDDFDPDDDYIPVRCPQLFEGRRIWFVRGEVPLRDEAKPGVLKMSMVDVQQGDGMILETPEGKVLFIDGGDNKLFARHVAARFRHRHSAPDDRMEVDAIIITHGDGDHFDGLNDLVRSEDLPDYKSHKRVFIKPRRVLHNGLVKLSSSDRDDDEILGATATHDDELYCVDLLDDPRDVPEDDRNRWFGYWCRSLDHWEQSAPIELKRVHSGTPDAFDFLDDALSVDVLGPFQDEIPDGDGGTRPALRFFGRPRRSAVLHLGDDDDDTGSPSSSHTINGHSIALRLTYGNVRLMLTGDLNHGSMQRMLDELGDDADDLLESEVVKAPHHGAADFSLQALQKMKPVVALVSSGDENAMKEYIHPRATLMAGLGQSMPEDEAGLVFVTELAAFFDYRKKSFTEEDLVEFFEKYELSDEEAEGTADEKTFTRGELLTLFRKNYGERPTSFHGFERTNFGIVHLRTDGERVLVFTHSGKKGLNEAYRFRVTRDDDGERIVTFADEVELG